MGTGIGHGLMELAKQQEGFELKGFDSCLK